MGGREERGGTGLLEEVAGDAAGREDAEGFMRERR